MIALPGFSPRSKQSQACGWARITNHRVFEQIIYRKSTVLPQNVLEEKISLFTMGSNLLPPSLSAVNW